MTTEVDIVNRALQCLGTRTTVTAAELTNETSNEAIQANLLRDQLRDSTLRMAPWNCAQAFSGMAYITSTPGTPENNTIGTNLWQAGQPPPPWSYEYQYPVDCLRPLWIVPQFQSGFSGGVPITTAVTGGSAAFWHGPPVKFKVATDQFFPVVSANVAAAGTLHAVGDIITLVTGPPTSLPIGAPVRLSVTSIGVGGAITGVSVVNQISGSAAPLGGSYFAVQSNPVAQGTTTGLGINATFNLTFGPKGSQRVILTNQEFAILSYIKQITDPNVMDPLFQDAWATILGARLVMALVGDKQLANIKVQEANSYIMEARKADGNESLTVNDVTPDWIRSRGISYSDYSYTPNIDFNWGQLWTPF
jgi:hypothetical protein